MPTMEIPGYGNALSSSAEAILLGERNRVARRVPLFLRSSELSSLPAWEQAEIAFAEVRSFSGRPAVRYVGFLWSALCLTAWWSFGPARLSPAPLTAVLVIGALLPAAAVAALIRRRIQAEAFFRQAVHASASTGV